jgi:hypothetical protein
MNAWQRISSWFFLCIAGVASAQVQGGLGVPSIETILNRMAQARAENRIHLRPYRVTRNYRLFGREKQTAQAEVIADVTFVPPDLKRYEIQQANGTGLGEKIVRQMLDHETDIVKNHGSTDVSSANYDFRFLREQELNGHRCFVLEMVPRRKAPNLLHGQIWVDSATFLLRRLEGEPARLPSWWLRDAHIVLNYGDVEGMWLQTASESTAKVRFLGQHTMVTRDVDYKFNELSTAADTVPVRRSAQDR